MKPSRDGEFPLSSSRDRATVRRLLQAAKDFHPPVTVTLAEIEAAAQSQGRGVGGMRFLLAGTAAAVLLLLAGGVAVSRGWVEWPRSRPTADVINPPAPARPGVARHSAGPAAPQPVPAPPLEMAPPEVPVIAEPVQRPRSHRAGSPPAVVASSAANDSSPSPAAAEVTQMRDALKKLRADRDPAGALPLLDDHDRRFPGGLLHDEVSAMRIEALMALGRTGEALEKVEALPDSLVVRWPRLRIVRGELRANHGRCADAMADFAALFSRPSDDEIRRRAEAGRDACLAQLRKVAPAP